MLFGKPHVQRPLVRWLHSEGRKEKPDLNCFEKPKHDLIPEKQWARIRGYLAEARLRQLATHHELEALEEQLKQHKIDGTAYCTTKDDLWARLCWLQEVEDNIMMHPQHHGVDEQARQGAPAREPRSPLSYPPLPPSRVAANKAAQKARALEVANAHSELLALRTQHAQLAAQHEQLAEQHAQLKDQHGQVCNWVRRQQERSAQLTAQAQAEMQQQQQVSTADCTSTGQLCSEQEAAALQAAIARKHARLQQLQEAAAWEQARVEQLQQAAATEEHTLRSLGKVWMHAIGEEETRLSAAKEQLAMVMQAVHLAQAAMESDKAAWAAKKAALRQQREELQQQRNELQLQCTELQQQREELRQQREEVQLLLREAVVAAAQQTAPSPRTSASSDTAAQQLVAAGEQQQAQQVAVPAAVSSRRRSLFRLSSGSGARTVQLNSGGSSGNSSRVWGSSAAGSSRHSLGMDSTALLPEAPAVGGAAAGGGAIGGGVCAAAPLFAWGRPVLATVPASCYSDCGSEGAADDDAVICEVVMQSMAAPVQQQEKQEQRSHSSGKKVLARGLRSVISALAPASMRPSVAV